MTALIWAGCYKATADWVALPLKVDSLFYVEGRTYGGWVIRDAATGQTGILQTVK